MFNLVFRYALCLMVLCFAPILSFGAPSLDDALDDINSAVFEDDGDAIVVRPTKNPELCAAAIRVAVSRCASKGIDTLVFEEGEYVILSQSKKDSSDGALAASEGGDAEPDVWADIADFFDIDSDDISDFRKSRATAPLVSASSIKIENLEDFTFDASKARFVCSASAPSFAFLNCKYLRVNMGEFLPRKKTNIPAALFAGCRGVSASVRADSANPSFFFSNCSNVIVKDSSFLPEKGTNPSSVSWVKSRGYARTSARDFAGEGEKLFENKKIESSALVGIIEFESCRLAASVRNCVFNSAEISPILSTSQCAVVLEKISDVRAVFDFPNTQKATVPFAAKGDEILLFSSDGAFLKRGKIVSASRSEGGREELEFDAPVFLASKRGVRTASYGTAATAVAKISVSYCKFNSCYAPLSIATSGGADFVSDTFSDMRGIAGVEIISNPALSACADLQNIKFVRNTFSSDGALALLSSTPSPSDDASGFVARNIVFSKNSFRLSGAPAALVGRALGVSFLDNIFAGCTPNATILAFDSCKNVSVLENSFEGAASVRLSDKNCLGKMEIRENSGAGIVVKKVFK